LNRIEYLSIFLFLHNDFKKFFL